MISYCFCGHALEAHSGHTHMANPDGTLAEPEKTFCAVCGSQKCPKFTSRDAKWGDLFSLDLSH